MRARLAAVLIALSVAGSPFGSMVEPARADDGPCSGLTGETIRWIVPFSPGGGFDAYSRILEPFLETRLNAEIVVTNVAGAGGMVGAKQLKKAKPDGRTLALLNASSLIISELLGTEDGPRLTEDFTILGSFGQESDVWLASARSDIRTMDDLLATARRAVIVYGSTAVANETWFVGSMGGDILGIEVDFLAGYNGSREMVLSLIRGEFDMTSLTWGSARGYVEAGDLLPLAQISNAPIADHPALHGVPVLGGPDGIAARRALALGQDPRAAQAKAEALVRISGAGRMVAAPANLDGALVSCLEDAVHDVMTDAEFEAALAKAKLPLDATRGSDELRTIRAAIRDLRPFVAAIQSRDRVRPK